MIGSFWNLCRACPSMPVDKLHSEYRSTYRWHEYTGPRQEVVRRPPQAASGGNQNAQQAGSEEENAAGSNPSSGAVPAWEPPLPRKKKHPELAYRTHEFIMSEGSDDSLDSTVGFDRARSEERTGRRMRPSRRSKSEGPPTRYGGSDLVDPFQSEYRLQYSKIMAARQQQQQQENSDTFAWPKPPPPKEAPQPPRKSLSMGALRAHAPAAVHATAPHKARRLDEQRAAASELEPLVDAQHADVLDAGNEDKILEETLEKPKKRKEFKTEYKKRFRPFTNYEYVDGNFIKRKHEADLMGPEPVSHSPVPVPDIGTPSSEPWYNEVIELRKKAGEYKHRGWGTELVPEHLADIYGKQVVLWEQVSRRSSLSALSLASASPRAITKEEKEKENNKKSSPTKGLARMPGRADRVDSRAQSKVIKAYAQVDKGGADDKREPRSRKEFLVRHHLERTTGAEDGALLVSPTREKLEPAMPRRKEEDSSNKSPSKGSPKSSPRSARSQSVGPSASENRSPKRQPRTPASTSSAASAAPKVTAPTERRPRPMVGGSEESSPLLKRAVFQSICNQSAATSLNTSSATRSKSSSVAMRNSSEDKTLGKSAKGAAQSGVKPKKAEPAKKQPPQPKKDDDKTSGGDTCDSGAATVAQQDLPEVHTQKPTPPSAGGSETKELAPAEELLSPDTNNTVSLIDDEPLVKSPPEPTRVKSPEQIIMRSPEPVNWTVPLDTGKTFTVTQNVREGELSRPHGESSRHWGAPALDVAFEGPQEIGVADAAQVVVLNGDGADSSDHSEATPPTQKSAAAVPAESVASAGVQSVAGTTLKRLDDPDLEPPPAPSTSSGPYMVLEAPEAPAAPARPSGYRVLEAPEPLEAPSARSVASDVLEKARNRFDMFWGTKDANKL